MPCAGVIVALKDIGVAPDKWPGSGLMWKNTG